MSRIYSIEGLAPLVFRSGKPFGAQAGADGAAFPLPSSLAGLLRTLHADQQGLPFDDALRQVPVGGPLLAWRETGGRITPLIPKPADAVYLRDENQTVRVLRLTPGGWPEGCGGDLPAGLLPVVMTQRLDGKPVRGAQYWPLAAIHRWRAGQAVDFAALERDGLRELPAETRTHVALDPKTGAARDGQLFQTGGIDLAPQRRTARAASTAGAGEQAGGWGARELIFVARSAANLSPTLATFGGERRLSRLSSAPESAWPRPATDLNATIREAGGLCLTLVTPALFGEGYLPGWLDPVTRAGELPGCPGLRLRLRAAAVERWLPVSGWDLAAHKPRATRRAVAAGAVYWFEVLDAPASDLTAALWLTALSDQPRDRLDGFGLGLPACWKPL